MCHLLNVKRHIKKVHNVTNLLINQYMLKPLNKSKCKCNNIQNNIIIVM